MKKYCCTIISVILQVFCIMTNLNADYLYPVVSYSVNNSQHVLLLYQSELHKTTVLCWDPSSHELTPVLASRFSPAGILLLPDGNGFSFIEHGRIYIKHWNSRSPKAIDIFEPIYAIEHIQWLTSDICYFQAKCGDLFGIYAAHVSGDVICLAQQDSTDCMYPQIVGDQLYYIERSMNADHYAATIKRNSIPALEGKFELADDTQEMSLIPVVDAKQSQLIMHKDDLVCIFLKMESAEEGYVIGYDPSLREEQEYADFSVYYMVKNKQEWVNSKLFSFSIPLELVVDGSHDRLFESIVPCLPKKFEDTFYYITVEQDDECIRSYLKSYELGSGTISVLASYEADRICTLLSPIKCGDTMFYGGSVQQYKNRSFLLPFLYTYNDVYKAHIPAILS